MNNIITLTEMNSTISKTFKDARLTQATNKIAKIYTDAALYAEQKNREIAKILDGIATGKLYEKDGFKSVADYANQIFNLSKSNAYALASAGRVYNDEKAPESLKAITPHKLAAVAQVDRTKLVKAINDGTLSPTASEKDFKAFAQENKPADKSKPELVKDYRIRLIAAPALNIDTSAHKPIEMWLDELKALPQFNGKPELVKLPNGYDPFPNGTMPKKATLIRRLLISHDFALTIEFKEYHSQVTKVETKVKGPRLTREELLAMLAEMDKAEGANVTSSDEK